MRWIPTSLAVAVAVAVALPALSVACPRGGAPTGEPIALDRTAPRDVASIARHIDAYFAPLAASKEVSGTLLVERDGEPLLVRHYGYADWSRKRPHTAETRYGAGSVTKGILAATIVELSRDGTVSLDDPVSRSLPALRPWPEMTLRRVLDHTAGLPREFPDGFDATRDSVAGWLAASPELITGPGVERYSNVGYALLAEAIQAATGQPFAAVATHRVLAPAGMTASTISPVPASGLPEGALAYTPGPEPAGVMSAPWSPPEVGSIGLVTTAADLARWTSHLAGGAYPELFEGDDPLGSIDTGMDSNGRYVSVQGTLPGYVANAIAWPGRGLVVSYTGNLFSAPALDMGDALHALLGDDPPTPPTLRPAAVALDASHRALAGRHELPGFGTVAIAHDAALGGMRLTMPGKPAHWSFHLTPIAGGALHWRAFGQVLRADIDGGLLVE